MCGIKYAEKIAGFEYNRQTKESYLTHKVFTDLNSERVRRIIANAEKDLKEALNQNNTPKNKT